jgi:DnaJ like chaperone protein
MLSLYFSSAIWMPEESKLVFDAGNNYPMWVIYFTLLLPFLIVGCVIVYQYRIFKINKVEKGIFKQTLKGTRDNLFEANLCLAIIMIKLDKVDVGIKLHYIKKYFDYSFQKGYHQYADTLSRYYQGPPIDVHSIANWINQNIQEHSKKTHILYFLAGISMVDGAIIDREYALLRKITFLLKLNEVDLDSILNTYKYAEQKKKQEDRNKRGKSPSSSSETALLHFAYKTLGLEKGASLGETKASYRRLVKIHHPDKFSSESEAQQKIAHERFLKIQEAYETIVKSYGEALI